MYAFKETCTYGPGGYKCPCCGPAPKHRVKMRRVARRRFKRQTEREIAEAA